MKLARHIELHDAREGNEAVEHGTPVTTSQSEPGGGLANTREGQMELLPCPFCGKTPILSSRPGINHCGRDWSIQCATPGCFNFVTTSSRYRSELIATWNKRPPSLPAVPDVKEEEKTLEEPGDVAVNTVQGPMGLTLAYGVEAALGNAERVLGCIVRALDHGALSMNPATLAPDIRQAAARIAVVMNSVRASTVPEEPKSSTGSEFPQIQFETGGRNALNLQMARERLETGPTLLDAKWLDPECWDGCQSLVFKRRATEAEELNLGLVDENLRLRKTIKSLQDARAASDGKEQGADSVKPEAQ